MPTRLPPFYLKAQRAFTQRLRWENLGIFSQSQLRIYLMKSHNNTFCGVNWKILRLRKVLLQFTEKGGDDCFDVIQIIVEENGIKHICMAYSQGAQKTNILKEVSFWVMSS
jgi:hypothetical protein